MNRRAVHVTTDNCHYVVLIEDDCIILNGPGLQEEVDNPSFPHSQPEPCAVAAYIVAQQEAKAYG